MPFRVAGGSALRWVIILLCASLLGGWGNAMAAAPDHPLIRKLAPYALYGFKSDHERLQEAQESFAELVERYPDDIRYYVALADITYRLAYRTDGNLSPSTLDDAATIIEAGLRIAPRNPEALRLYAAILGAQSEWDAMRSVLDKLDGRQARDAETRLLMAQWAIHQAPRSAPEQTIPLLKPLLGKTASRIHRIRATALAGLAYMARDEWTDADRAMLALLRQTPNGGQVKQEMAERLTRLGRDEESATWLEIAEAEGYETAKSNRLLATNYMNVGWKRWNNEQDFDSGFPLLLDALAEDPSVYGPAAVIGFAGCLVSLLFGVTALYWFWLRKPGACGNGWLTAPFAGRRTGTLATVLESIPADGSAPPRP